MLTWAIVAIIAAGLFILWYRGSISTTEKNVLNLQSCKTQGGQCRPSCLPDETGFFKSGCPIPNENVKANEPNGDYCCIKKDNA